MYRTKLQKEVDPTMFLKIPSIRPIFVVTIGYIIICYNNVFPYAK